MRKGGSSNYGLTSSHIGLKCLEIKSQFHFYFYLSQHGHLYKDSEIHCIVVYVLYCSVTDDKSGIFLLLYLVKEVDFCHRVSGLSRVFDQQRYEPNKGIQVVVTLGSDDGCTGCWVVLLLSLSPIAYLHTHFCAQPEEPCDQVICLQDALLVHLGEKER